MLNTVENNIYPNKNSNCNSVYINTAQSAITALAVTLNISYREAYSCLLEQAHRLCLMPNDARCVAAMLRAAGFVLQPGQYTNGNYKLYDIWKYMNENCRDMQTAIVGSGYGAGEHLTAIIPNTSDSKNSVYIIKDTKDCTRFFAGQIWIRWKDGKDHSPINRRKGNGKRKKSAYAPPADHECFHCYNANPANNSTGDCVIRAMAAVLGTTWHEALDKLAEAGNYIYTTVNSSKLCQALLKKEGFIKNPIIVRNGKRLTGSDFCRELTKTYYHGERIFAMVGSSHVAAILPVKEPCGIIRYKIIDSWDSTDRKIGEYWVKPASKNKSNGIHTNYFIGSYICHPDFGKGIILKVSGTDHNCVLEVEFEEVGLKKLSADWVSKNCS